MSEKIFGYQIWKPVSEDARKTIMKQMEINDRFENQPTAQNYKLFSDEIIDTSKHPELMRSAPGYSTSLYDMVKNFRDFKNNEFEIGDAIVIYHTFEEGKKSYPSIVIVGNYFYGWSFKECKHIQDYEPTLKTWEDAIANS